MRLEQLEARRVLAAALFDSTPQVVAPQYSQPAWGEESTWWGTAEQQDAFVPASELARPVSSLAGEGESGGGNGGGGDAASVFYYSPSVSGFVKNSNHSKLFVDDSDVVKLSVFSNNSWKHEIYFDGSDVGLSSHGENIDAFAIRPDGSLLFSTTGDANVSGVKAEPEDLLRFIPTKLGSHTSGSWQLFLDGSDVGLSSWEGLDGVSELPDGRLIVSVQRTASLPGISSSVKSEDLVALTLTSTGNHSSGSWERYFDGSDVHLGGLLENVDGVSVDSDGTTVHLSTSSLFIVPGLLGFGRDIFTFEAEQLGSHTDGQYRTPLTLNGSHRGLLFNSINAIHIPSQSVANQPPIIDAISSPTVPELAPFQLQLSANDPDTPATQLVWSLVSAPSEATLDPTTGMFAWTPDESQGPGVFPVIVAVTDGNSLAQATFTISVTEVNQPPVIAPINRRTVDEGTQVSLQVFASDADLPAQTLTYALGPGAPSGATISSLGRFRYTPTETDGPGQLVVPVIVTDSLGASSTVDISITVREVNQPPAIAPINRRTVDEGTQVSLQVSASDADLPAQTLTYAIGPGAPSGATISSLGRFRYTPTEADGPGQLLIPIIVTDSQGASSTANVPIVVREVNLPPVLAPISDQTIDSNQTLSLTAVASDPDLPANALTFSLDTGPLGATIDSQTGVVSWMPNAAGVENFLVRVTDNGSPALSSTEAFSVTVQGITGGDIELTEGTFVRERSFAIELGQAEGTRTLRFRVDSTFDRTDNATEIGDVFSVYVVDSLNPSQTLLNRGLPGTAIFSLAESGSIELATGLVQFNGQYITVDLSSLGTLTGATVVLQLLSHDMDSESSITISEITNTVDPEGVAPTFLPNEQIFASPGAALNYEALSQSSAVSAHWENIRFDPTIGLYTAELNLTSAANVGSSLAVSFPGLPAGVQLLNASGTNASGLPYLNLSPTAPSGGLRPNYPTQKVLLQFSVAPNSPFVLTPEIAVGVPNRAPVVAPIGPFTAVPGDALVIPIDVTDLDGDRVTLSIQALNGMPTSTLRADNTLLVTPRPDGLGTYQFTLIANDGALQASQDVTITVAEDPLKTTRISGVVQNTNQQPLAGVPVQLGRHQSVTGADGSFTIELPSFETPTEVFDIVVPTGDPQFDPFSTGDRTITLFRSGFDVTTGTSTSNPRLHTNLVSSFIDASAVYGSDAVRAAALREFDGSGKLKTSVGNLLPVNNSDTFPTGTVENENNSQFDPTTLFAAGDVRANENAPLMAMHTLLVREHNRKADEIASADPTLTDEVIYQQSRRWVTAVMQQITYNEFLPLLLGANAQCFEAVIGR